MSCPFLKEGRARYCHAAPVRKLILDGPGATEGGRCTSPRYVECELATKNGTPQDRCPHLEEMRVQFCGVSPIPKLVPFSDSQLSNCTSNTYRYCDSYLHLAQPHCHQASSQSSLYLQSFLAGRRGLRPLPCRHRWIRGRCDWSCGCGHVCFFAGNALSRSRARGSRSGVADELSESVNDSEGEYTPAQRSVAVDGGPVWRRMVVRRLGNSWPHARRPDLGAASRGLASHRARATLERDPRNARAGL